MAANRLIGTTPDGEATPGPVVRDRRRLDPETGQVRAGSHRGDRHARPDAADADPGRGTRPGRRRRGGPGSGTAADGSAELETARALAEERLADLQRLQAEYVNYRRRVERDRDVARENAVAGVLEALLPVLDDVHLARQHGDLESGPFAAIADKLESDARPVRAEPVRRARRGVRPDRARGADAHPGRTGRGHHGDDRGPGAPAGLPAVDGVQRQVLRAARVAVADPQ